MQNVSLWTAGHTRTGPSSYTTGQLKDVISPIQAHHHYLTSQPKVIWPHSCKTIGIRQQVGLRKFARTNTGPSPLCKMSD